jgi:hypothetical protein
VKLHCVHRIELGADRFWEVLHSAPYETAVAEATGLREYREVERREDEREVYRKIHVVAELPEALRKLLARAGALGGEGGGLASSTEEQWRSKSERCVRWRMTPAFLSGRLRVEGSVRIEPVDTEHCDRILEGDVECRLFGLGGLVERVIAANAESTYARAAEVATRFRAD